MTKEQYNKLTKYELMFHSAIEAKYIRAMDSRFATDFIAICKDLNIYINTSCPACVLKAALTLGKLYFNYKEQNPDKRDIPSSDKAEPINSSVLIDSSDSIDLFEEFLEQVKTVKPSKTTSINKKASQNVKKQPLKKKSK